MENIIIVIVIVKKDKVGMSMKFRGTMVRTQLQ